MIADNPILNSPYQEPKLHYNTNSEGSLDYTDICKGRRVFKQDSAVIPSRQKGQKEVFEWNDDALQYGTHIINLCRKEVGLWRNAKYPNITRVSKELLSFWFDNPERLVTKKLFFAQQEAVETAIWLNEVAEKSNAGQHILNLLRDGQQTVSEDIADQLPRIAFKMATGSGKTVVMACLICYHYFNRQEYKNDTRFADYFLIIAPGVTIKSRLGVLFVDTENKNPRDISDYYRMRGLIPANMEHRLENLNARLVITNYHSFEPKILQGNKRSPFDGKTNLQGEKIDTDNKEDFSQVVKRTLGKFKTGSRVLILNDEAHHCYLPKSKSKTTDNEEADENARAAVWFNGIREIAKKFKLQSVYDLSATPYYLTGSGHTPYSLFPWVVSDFGLIEAIESGLVKIPFLPESDNTQELTVPILRNLYDHVRDDLPKKGQRTKKREAIAEGSTISEQPPKLPSLVKGALDQFYNHYVDYDLGVRKNREAKANLFSAPPVFIAVCNNTSVSKEVYKYIAGYEYTNADGDTVIVHGAKDLFSNYDPSTNKPLKRPPTLLIDSDALENSEQVNDDFKKIFSSEIEEFKKDYVKMYGQGSVDKITDAEILREVVNTVGQQGKLGSHIRCVVSVSMLTEGWDANTVTHIMGLRAFGSQLLCEQVAGRALRRMSYILQGYDKEGNPTNDKRKIVIEKFPPEYAHIIGVPFKMFKGGKSEPPPPPIDLTHIAAIPERQATMEIVFPNVVGYRVENYDGEIKFDFTKVENYEIDGSKFPTETIMASPISANEETLKLKSVLERRDHELIFTITKELIKYHFSDENQENLQFHKFNKLKQIVEFWYNEKVILLNITDQRYKRWLFFEDPKKIVDHIIRGINPEINTSEFIRPIFNYYNKFNSTKYVNGNTVKDVFPTQKSHVNYVVMDSDWEGICAKSLEEIETVECYVKNQFLGVTVPYVKNGKDHLYYPDFVARVKTQDGVVKNLLIEISGMSNDKAEKKWFVENRWIPAVNALKDKYEYPEWHFIEIANDIRNIKNQLIEKIQSL
ncbi:BPTD_3080 family restriction endonuclease [Arcicella rigui]|uniref:DEAD/DEAH box helicase family protein n=1 Tax=Arcicella rigui TaxID=797020 RepID=A0ABU5Q8Q4_9BACT|nr:DEAD/DEAH box helicase family protein [Arcicella rigui]MEA5139225.1 DEAD/DEAH box helicase family protein [Arcicella rigui]